MTTSVGIIPGNSRVRRATSPTLTNVFSPGSGDLHAAFPGRSGLRAGCCVGRDGCPSHDAGADPKGGVLRGGNTIAPGGYAEVPFRKEAVGRRSRGKSRPVRPMGPAPGVPDGGKPEYAAKPRAPGGRLRELKTPRAKGGDSCRSHETTDRRGITRGGSPPQCRLIREGACGASEKAGRIEPGTSI